VRAQSAVGYRLNFRSTHTTVTGMADTYGGIKALVEREVLKDVKVAAYLHYNPFQPQVSAGPSSWGGGGRHWATHDLVHARTPCLAGDRVHGHG